MNNSSTSTDPTPNPPQGPPPEATDTPPEGNASQAQETAVENSPSLPPNQPAPPTEAEAPAEATAPVEAPAEQAPAPAESPAAPPAAPTADATPSAEAAAPAAPGRAGVASPPPVRTGTVAAVRGDDVVIEFAGKRAGICPASAFAKPPTIGQRLGFVVAHDTDETKGPVKIIRPAVGAAAPTKTPLSELNVGDVFETTVVGMNTGGLEVKVAGHRAFLPASQIDRHRIENYVPYLNQTLRCRIVELNRRKRRIVVSHRSVLEDENRAQLSKKMADIKVGEVRECKVRNIEKFGIFLQWEPGIDGLVRLMDVAHGHIDDPKSVVKVGDTVKAKALRVEAEKGRLTLGMRQAMPSPWKDIETRYPVGSDQTGTVTRTADFGAFVELEPGIEGLIHISQLATQRVEKVEQIVREGQQVTARVVQCEAKRKRVGLSIRALTEPEAMPTGKASRDDLRKYVKKDAKQAHATQSLGSLMKKFGDADGLKGGIG